MVPGTNDYAKVKRRLEAAAERPSASPEAVIETFLSTTADVLDMHSACWHHTDPTSGSPIRSAATGDAPGSVEQALEYEYRRPDVNRFADMFGQGIPAAGLSTSTGERPRDSARYREMIEPVGSADELRVALRDSFGTATSRYPD